MRRRRRPPGLPLGSRRRSLRSSGSRLPEELHDFAAIRKPLLLVLAEHQPVIDVDVEYAASSFHQVRFDAECATQLVCQADGLAVIVSWLAPDDLGSHRCLHVNPSSVSPATATRNTVIVIIVVGLRASAMRPTGHKSMTTSPIGREQQTRTLPSAGLSSGSGPYTTAPDTKPVSQL